MRAAIFSLSPACGRREVAIGQALLEDRLGRLPMQRQALGLAVLFVPAEIQPAQPFEDGIERGFGVALDVGVVDAQDHGAAVAAGVQPVEDERARAADVEKARGRGRKADSKHGKSKYNKVQKPASGSAQDAHAR